MIQNEYWIEVLLKDTMRPLSCSFVSETTRLKLSGLLLMALADQGRGGRPSRPQSHFFILMQFLAKIMPNNRLASSLVLAPLEKSQFCHCCSQRFVCKVINSCFMCLVSTIFWPCCSWENILLLSDPVSWMEMKSLCGQLGLKIWQIFCKERPDARNENFSFQIWNGWSLPLEDVKLGLQIWVS